MTHAASPLRWRYEPVPADEQVIRALVTGTGAFTPEECDVAVELVHERLTRGPSSGYHFVFGEDPAGQVVGYGCYGHIAATAGSFDVYWIAVDQALQGRGFGKLVFAECERLIRAAGGRKIYIETSGRADYDAQRAFYLRTGYTQEAVLKDFYRPGDDKVFFVKTVDT